ncbi:MAG: hypothetical protein AB8B53_13855 [Flavobacteriales bacterium]
MIEELLKIMFEADVIISKCQYLNLNEQMQAISSGIEELQEIDDKIYQHFQEQLGL